MKYKFIFGNTPDLAREELKSLLDFKELYFNPPVLVLETNDPIPFEKLGGTVKVGEIIDESILENLKRYEKVDFGISDYTKDPIARSRSLQDDTKEIKQKLQELGIKARFVLPSQGTELSSVIVKKQKLIEFLVMGKYIAKTIWVQDFEDWGRRDYGRPEVEAHIGMLPPKVARMMVNISQGKTILDPFCGVGTILMEGCELGLTMIGTDISSAQIEKTKKNLASFGMKAKVYVGDARKVKEQVDAIVTEVDLGHTTRIMSQELGIMQRLRRLYLECFQNWRGLAKKIVIALPDEEIIDKAINMGYILEAGPFEYARPQAKVKRHILVFRDVTR